MTGVSRRKSLELLGGSLAASALAIEPADARAKSFVAFGDSYTRSYRNGIASWADQISASGAAKLVVNLAYSGATAEGTNTRRTLDGQVDIWVKDYQPHGVPDRTVIYFGYNDIAPDKPLGPAMYQYRVCVDRLISYGVTQGSRCLVLCKLHDWSHNPSRKTSALERVRTWNHFVADIAAERSNVLFVRLFARFEDVFNNKSKYGFTNVTSVNRELSATTFLYADGSHFGRKGQSIIAREIRPMLL